MKTHAILLAAAIALAAPPTAHADDIDDTYLHALHIHGITSTAGDQELIKEAHDICTVLGSGLSMNAVVDNLELHQRNGMADADTKFVVKAAAASYCPEYIQ